MKLDLYDFEIIMGYKIKNVYIWNKLVWGQGSWPTPPTPGWEPGPNTVAYFPLTSITTYYDQTANENNLDGGSATYWVYQGIDCAYFNRSDEIHGTVAWNVYSWDPRTFSCWCYLTAISGEWDIFSAGSNGCHNAFQLYYSDWWIWVRTYYDDAVVSWVSSYLNRWINLVGTYDGNGNVIAYINWTQVASSGIFLDTYSSEVYIGRFLTNGLIGWVSNAIIEDVAWGASEVLNYFNATKWEYGVS